MIDEAVAAPIEAEEDDDEPEEPGRSSFFAEGEDADELVCETVWRLFVRDSIEKGFASRTDAGLDTRKQKFRPKPEKAEGAMAELKRGELPGHVKACFNAFRDKHGRAPDVQELFDEVGEAVGKSVENVRAASKRAGLALATRQKGGGASAVPTPAKKRGPRVHRTPATNGSSNGAHTNGVHHEEPPASGNPGAFLAIMALQTQRAKIAAQLDAIDGVIEGLRK